MRTLNASSGETTIVVNRDELRLISNALNEVCNALDVQEFSTRLGADLEAARALLKEFVSADDVAAQS